MSLLMPDKDGKIVKGLVDRTGILCYDKEIGQDVTPVLNNDYW